MWRNCLIFTLFVGIGLILKGHCQGGQNVQNGTMEQWNVKPLYPRLIGYTTNNAYSFIEYDTVTVVPDIGVGGIGKSIRISIVEAMGDTLQGFVVADVPDTSGIDSFTIWVRCELAPGDTALILLFDDLPSGGFNYVRLVQLWDTISTFQKRSSINLGSCISCDTLRFVATWLTNGGSKGTPGSTFWIDSLVIYKNGNPTLLFFNPGFELWDSIKTQYPTSWFALVDYFGIDNDPFADVFSVEVSTDAIEGNFSAKLIPRQSPPFLINPMSVLLYGMDKSIISKLDNDEPLSIPFFDEPDTLVFSYKTIGAPQSDSIYIFFSKWDTIANKRDTLLMIYDSLVPSSSWNTIKVPLNLSRAPDSMGLGFGVWSSVSDGSVYLLVDNVNFVYSSVTGVPHIMPLMDDDQPIYASHRKLYFRENKMSDQFESIVLYDLSGVKVFTFEISSPVDEVILPQTLPAGVYIYHLYGKSNQQAKIYVGKIWVGD